jgi:hypothetical protein
MKNPDYHSPDQIGRKTDHKNSDRNANKVFARLYASRKCISGLEVSQGSFLCNTSRMVSGDLVHKIGGSLNLDVHSKVHSTRQLTFNSNPSLLGLTQNDVACRILGMCLMGVSLLYFLTVFRSQSRGTAEPT